jgi:GTP pyrophosphokinase
LEWQRELKDPKEFMESLKIDLFTNQVFVFTPKGDVVELPFGSTPVDFAYKIHSAVGNSCIGAKVDGRIVPLDYKLKTGNIVEILTSSNNNGPSRDWLKFVKSTHAKNKIKQWFKKERKDENINRGKELLEKEVKRQGYTAKQLLRVDWLNSVVKQLRLHSIDDLYAAVGYGGIALNQVVPKLKEKYRQEQKESQQNQPEEETNKLQERITKSRPSNKAKQGVRVKGIDNILVRFAKCCSPVPGDEIVGYITRGRGITVHRQDCLNVTNAPEAMERLIEVEWDKDKKSSYQTEIQIVAPDRKGLLSEITNIITEAKLHVTAVNAKTTKEKIAIINLTIEISSTDQLLKIMNKFKSMPEVIDVKRVTS